MKPCANCGYDEEIANLSKDGFCDTCQSAYEKGIQKALNEPTILHNTGWVAQDGSYGTCAILVFEVEDLSEEQWDKLEATSDSYKFEKAVDFLITK